MVAAFSFSIFAILLSISAWRMGAAWFYFTQITGLATFLVWAGAFGQDHVLSLGMVFAFLALMINVKYLTDTTWFDLKYFNLKNFKSYCGQSSTASNLGSFTIFGLYILGASIWLLAIVKILDGKL